jgi:hypothetical protein
MDAGTNFEWQHDARLRGRTLSLYDDAADPQEERQSSAKILKLDTKTRTISLVRRLTHYPPLLAGAGGSVQRLSNGDWLVGWGSAPQFSEYTSSGQLVFNGTLPLGDWSYRAFRFPWLGRPLTRPSLAVSARADGHVVAYMSWNGATLLTSWRVLGGSSPAELKPLGLQVRRGDFETAIDVPDAPRYVAAQALGAKGNVLRTSVPEIDPSHLAIFGSKVFLAASSRYTGIPVGCSSARDCQVSVSVSAGGSILGRSVPERVPSYRGRLVYVRLRGRVAQRTVRVAVSDGSDPTIRRNMTLIPYTASAAGHQMTSSSAPGVQVVNPTGFVSSAGRAGVLLACNSGFRCRFQEIVTAGGQTMGRATNAILGADELAYVEIRLNRRGRTELAHARDNRLPAQLKLIVGRRGTTKQIDLVQY